ncbi:hypothetical protein [Schleiferilactobacillus shenzhenensis]|uniref:Uncharacterized protein n=1 Tax=Schleiferilactobacillus shenzhenensis LY-73 TaxID=1231336 RepID=U4TH38_9LACO|nr:hypothetical protein [Schleiferilactobacillus shenzhenensis]ERL64111.1 hypothetical protein L248_1644 [Schleiferilactobacillus shenzhenensis LY-73]
MPEKKKPTSRWGCWVQLIILAILASLAADGIRAVFHLGRPPSLRSVFIGFGIFLVMLIILFVGGNAAVATAEKHRHDKNK